MTENAFSTDAIASALETREMQLRDQRLRDDTRKIVRAVTREIDEVAQQRVYGAPVQQPKAATDNPAQPSNSDSNESQQPSGRQVTPTTGSSQVTAAARALSKFKPGTDAWQDLVEDRSQRLERLTGRPKSEIADAISEEAMNMQDEESDAKKTNRIRFWQRS